MSEPGAPSISPRSVFGAAAYRPQREKVSEGACTRDGVRRLSIAFPLLFSPRPLPLRFTGPATTNNRARHASSST